MVWQDLALMLGGFGFALALLPALKSIAKPPRSTCLLTAIILLVYAVAYASLGLWMAFSAALITKGLWVAILFQKRRN